MNGILYKGAIVPAGFQVQDGRELKVEGSLLQPCWWEPTVDRTACRPRTAAPRFGVVHHQAGEGGPTQHCSVLRHRKCSVHFQIDQHGAITQLADLNTVCYHAGDFNGASWGVEVANLGIGASSARFPRRRYKDMLHGHNANFLAFYPEQLEACRALIVVVHQIFGLPCRVPTNVDGKALRGVISDTTLAIHQVIAHYMLTKGKVDPAPDMMDFLAVELPR